MYTDRALKPLLTLHDQRVISRRTCLMAGAGLMAQLAGCGGGGEDFSTVSQVHVNGGVVTTLKGVAPLNSYGLVFDSKGNLFISDVFNHIIIKRTPAGVVSTFAGKSGEYGTLDDAIGTNARFRSPGFLTIDAKDNLFMGEFDAHSIRKITAAGAVSTFAG